MSVDRPGGAGTKSLNVRIPAYQQLEVLNRTPVWWERNPALCPAPDGLGHSQDEAPNMSSRGAGGGWA